MKNKNDLDSRMKDYEKRNRHYLQKRVPVIIRLDIRAGHTFLKGFKRPFDEVFIKSMQETAKYLCENIQNCKLSYQQSDEITLLLIDYDKLNTDCFFNYRVDKLCSITASMATMAFNKALEKNIKEWQEETFSNVEETNEPNGDIDLELYNLEKAYLKAINKGAMFDARCFNIPKEEVTNNFYWRQLDASRNSVQMVGQACFSDEELKSKKNNEVQDMLMLQRGINWNNLPIYQKRGSCCIKVTSIDENPNPKGDSILERSYWIIDKEIPIFRGKDRAYIDDLVYVGE